MGLVVFCVAFLAACGDDQDTQATGEPQLAAAIAPAASPSNRTFARKTVAPYKAAATTNFVADWARLADGDRVGVFGLIPADGDPHSFMPGARDIARVADADVVLTAGLRLEAGWLEELEHNASADESRIVALGDSVDPVEFATAELHDGHGSLVERTVEALK